MHARPKAERFLPDLSARIAVIMVDDKTQIGPLASWQTWRINRNGDEDVGKQGIEVLA
jgi:hypothetical protein